MSATSQILTLLAACLALFSSLVWLIMMMLSVMDSNTRQEKQVKTIAMWLFIHYIAMWTFMIAYQYRPPAATFLNITGYLGLVLVPVQLYRLVCKLSETDRLKPFSLWHYALPVAVAGSLAVWSLLVPFDVQRWLIENRGAICTAYPAYSVLFTSKPIARLVFTAVYLPLCIVRLCRYYKDINRGKEKIRRPAIWVYLFIGCVVTVFIGTLFGYIYPRSELIVRWPTLTAGMIVLVEHAVIGYHIISRDFLLYIRHEEDTAPGKPFRKLVKQVLKKAATEDVISLKKETKFQLTRKEFDSYMKTRKPWLDPHFLITDLVEPFGTTRNKISAFVNRTYGINFNRYLNRLRLREMERLVAKPSNAGTARSALAIKAGFANERNYYRALKAEQDVKTTKGSSHE